MKTARYASLLAGAVCLYGFAAAAAESPAYRGLKLPTDALESEPSSYGIQIPSRTLRDARVELPAVAPRILFSGDVQSRRFRSRDYAYRLTLHQPLGHAVAALSQPNIHSLHHALPRYTLDTHITRALPGAFGIGFGLRQTEYSFSTSNLLSVSAERNWGSFRGAYTLYSNQAEGALASAHRFEVNYLYGERNSIALSYTTGRDIDNFGVPLTPFATDVRDWSLSGRHWLTPNWALHYDVLTGDEGPFYRRQGLRLGVSRSF